MSWDLEESEDGTVKVTLEKDGESMTKKFPGDTTVGEAAEKWARANNVKKFDLEDSNGAEVSQDESDTKLSEVGNLTMRPAAGGYS